MGETKIVVPEGFFLAVKSGMFSINPGQLMNEVPTAMCKKGIGWILGELRHCETVEDVRSMFLAPKPEVPPIDPEKERFRIALEKLARFGNGDHWGNSEGNTIAQEALMKRSFAPKTPEPEVVYTGDNPKDGHVKSYVWKKPDNPEVPEAIKDLFWQRDNDGTTENDLVQTSCHNAGILEAYRRGQKSSGKVMPGHREPTMDPLCSLEEAWIEAIDNQFIPFAGIREEAKTLVHNAINELRKEKKKD